MKNVREVWTWIVLFGDSTVWGGRMVGAEAVCHTFCVVQGDFKWKNEPGLTE